MDSGQLGYLSGVEINQAETFLDFDDEDVSIQERHYAMHVLTFFSFMVQLIHKGKGVHRSLVDRTIYHLLHLREFIQDYSMGDLVTRLSSELSLAFEDCPVIGPDQDRIQMESWFDKNEGCILELATFYGKQEAFQECMKVA